MKLLFLMLAIGAFTLSSCLKGGEPTEIRVAKVAFLNAVPGSEGLDIALDQRYVNNPNANNPDFAYRDTLGYVNAFPGQRLVRVFEPGVDVNQGLLANGMISLVPEDAYTIYVVGHEEIELLATKDNLGAPAPGKAKIRFINLSPDAPSLSFGVRGEETLIGNDKEFKKYSDFVEIDGDETYTFDITIHESGDLAYSFSLNLEEGGIYTVWASGLFTDVPEFAFGHGVLDYNTTPPAETE